MKWFSATAAGIVGCHAVQGCGMLCTSAEPNFFNLQFLPKVMSIARQRGDPVFLSSLVLELKPTQGHKLWWFLATALGTCPHFLSLYNLLLCWHSGKGSAPKACFVSNTKRSPQTHKNAVWCHRTSCRQWMGQKSKQTIVFHEWQRRNHSKERAEDFKWIYSMT